MPGQSEPEVLLVGGIANRGQVVRVGDTVRRPQRATSPAIHALLRHLADVGFAGAPRFLDVDDQGREVLSYVPGTAVMPPYPAWSLDFDLASPGCRVWDVACAARLWAPLRPDAYIRDRRRGRALDRLRLFVDSYGLADVDRDRLMTAVRRNHEWLYAIVGTEAANGHSGFGDYWAGGAMERAERTSQWYLDNEEVLRRALL